MFVSFSATRFVSKRPLPLTSLRAVHDDPVFSPDGDTRDWRRRETDGGKQRLTPVIPPQMPRRGSPRPGPGDPRRGDPFREPNEEPTPFFPEPLPLPEESPSGPGRGPFFIPQTKKRSARRRVLNLSV